MQRGHRGTEWYLVGSVSCPISIDYTHRVIWFPIPHRRTWSMKRTLSIYFIYAGTTIKRKKHWPDWLRWALHPWYSNIRTKSRAIPILHQNLEKGWKTRVQLKTWGRFSQNIRWSRRRQRWKETPDPPVNTIGAVCYATGIIKTAVDSLLVLCTPCSRDNPITEWRSTQFVY